MSQPTQEVRTALHAATAIDYAQLEAVLGGKTASRFQVRELIPADGIYLHERASRRIRTTKNRTHNFAVTIVEVTNPRRPLFSLIATKQRSKSATLVVHDTHAELSDISDALAGRLVFVLLLCVQSFAYLSGADRIRVSDVGDPRLQLMLQHCGYELNRRKGGLLYATRRLMYRPTSLSPAH